MDDQMNEENYILPYNAYYIIIILSRLYMLSVIFIEDDY